MDMYLSIAIRSCVVSVLASARKGALLRAVLVAVVAPSLLSIDVLHLLHSFHLVLIREKVPVTVSFTPAFLSTGDR